MNAQSATKPADAIAALIADADPNDCVVPTGLIRDLLASERSAPNLDADVHARRADAINEVVAHCRMILSAPSTSSDVDMLAETIVEWLTEDTDR